MKTKIIQITAGRGPAECCWVVAQILKYFLKEIQQIGLSYTIIDQARGIENGTVQSVTVQLEGARLSEFLTAWVGTIQWIGTSPFRKNHRRKNWFVGCYELDQWKLIVVSEKDMTFQTMRSSGPGGQNVNKVNSAVRAIHNQSGTQVVAMDSRSQHQNRKVAIERLKEKLQTIQLKNLQKSLNDQWENHLNVERGNPIRIFRGTDFKKQKTKKIKTFKKQRNKLKNDFYNQLKNEQFTR